MLDHVSPLIHLSCMSPCRLGPPRIALGAIVASVLSRFCVLVSCNQFSRLVSGRAPPHPCRAERWKDCSDDHALWICWNRACFHSFHRRSCPCPPWFVVDMVTPFGHHMLKLIVLISSSLPCAAPPTYVRRHVLQDASTARSTSSLPPRSERLLCCAARSSYPCSSRFIAHASVAANIRSDVAITS
jgi:hypothetical protein